VDIGRRATFSAALYRNEVKDNIDFHASQYYTPLDPPPAIPGFPTIPDPPGPIVLALVPLPKTFTYRNVGSARYQGLELGLNVQFVEGVNGVFSYTWQDDALVRDDTPLDPLELGVPPHHQVSAGVNVERGRWKGSFGASYTDDAFWTDVLDSRFWGSTDAFLILSGSLGVKLADDRLELLLNGTNLADRDVKQHVFGDTIGRKVTAALKVRW